MRARAGSDPNPRSASDKIGPVPPSAHGSSHRRGKTGLLIPFSCLATLASLLLAAPAAAFPPYRSTDAGTADPWALEARVGLLRLRRDRGDNLYSTPLLRLNLGLPRGVELIGELEVRPGRGGITDAALGAKWVPVHGRWSAGIETLLLLPVPDARGTGVESQLVFTYRDDTRGLRLHLNGGGFYDGRPDPAEKAWRASALAELKRGRYRPGLEVFSRKIGARPVEVLAGPGVIVEIGRMDVRLGLHVGLTAAAPDMVLDLWTSTAIALRR